MPVLDRAELELYIYDGTSGSYTDSDLRYELSKTRISSQDNIIFEISELVRDYIDLTFNDVKIIHQITKHLFERAPLA